MYNPGAIVPPVHHSGLNKGEGRGERGGKPSADLELKEHSVTVSVKRQTLRYAPPHKPAVWSCHASMVRNEDAGTVWPIKIMVFE